MDQSIYRDIANRTGGDVYIGVVGPVRTGKSTFIKRFMETLVIDKIDNEGKRARTIDELPQSADGKTIMTTEPKFVPAEAVRINVDKTAVNVRLIDCVGYVVDGVSGHLEDEKPRMVHTPWSDLEMPFQEAATIGTDKVIREHSTIGIVVLTDGSITGISRNSYNTAEDRIMRELKLIGKPFVVVLNSINADSTEVFDLAVALRDKYNVSVIPLNVASASPEQFATILNEVLMEFPISSVDIELPKWMRALPQDGQVISDIIACLKTSDQSIAKMKDYEKLCTVFDNLDILQSDPDTEADAGTGVIKISFRAKDGIFYKVLSDECGTQIDDERKLMNYVVKAGMAYRDYEKLRSALDDSIRTGYGIVSPTIEQLQLSPPELVKKGDQYGIKIKATAPSVHIVRVDVESELCPTIGSEHQSEDLVNKLKSEFETDQAGIWQANLFGKSLSDLVKDDMSSKIRNMPEDVQQKIKRTITRVINESRGGVLCILL